MKKKILSQEREKKVPVDSHFCGVLFFQQADEQLHSNTMFSSDIAGADFCTKRQKILSLYQNLLGQVDAVSLTMNPELD